MFVLENIALSIRVLTDVAYVGHLRFQVRAVRKSFTPGGISRRPNLALLSAREQEWQPS